MKSDSFCAIFVATAPCTESRAAPPSKRPRTCQASGPWSSRRPFGDKQFSLGSRGYRLNSRDLPGLSLTARPPDQSQLCLMGLDRPLVDNKSYNISPRTTSENGRKRLSRHPRWVDVDLGSSTSQRLRGHLVRKIALVTSLALSGAEGIGLGRRVGLGVHAHILRLLIDS